MINANELRIGNYVIYHGDKDGDMFCKLDAQDIFNIATGYMDNDKIHSPIPLTTEILEKAGFEFTSKGFATHPKWYNLSLKLRNGNYDLRCAFVERVATNINYLHQLQNLYFTLTGNELEINL